MKRNAHRSSLFRKRRFDPKLAEIFRNHRQKYLRLRRKQGRSKAKRNFFEKGLSAWKNKRRVLERIRGLANLYSVFKLTVTPVVSTVQLKKPFRENWMKMNHIARVWNYFLKMMRVILQKYKPVPEIYDNIFSQITVKC